MRGLSEGRPKAGLLAAGCTAGSPSAPSVGRRMSSAAYDPPLPKAPPDDEFDHARRL